jgi:hypothetical protein
VLREASIVKNLANILKTNVSVCKSVGAPFFVQVCCLFFCRDDFNLVFVVDKNLYGYVECLQSDIREY